MRTSGCARSHPRAQFPWCALTPLAGQGPLGRQASGNAHANAHKGGPQGSLISRQVSRLDAFSGYLFRT
jgi:hypothetical protein